MPKPADGWTADHLKDLLDREVNRLHQELIGFPEHYATRQDMELMRSMIEGIRGDHVTRREADDLRQRLEALRATAVPRIEFDDVKAAQSEGAGRRMATVVAISVLMTLLGILFAAVWKSQPSHADISQQIQVESPWLSDRPQVEKRITVLENQVVALKAELAQHSADAASQRSRIQAIEKLDVFFCRTRAVKGLAPC